ncbi:clathrin heavy chain 1 [Pelomyxa schiedti]|nr:clathrin heavy chain 1 [Pelomyxa schiedti]
MADIVGQVLSVDFATVVQLLSANPELCHDSMLISRFVDKIEPSFLLAVQELKKCGCPSNFLEKLTLATENNRFVPVNDKISVLELFVCEGTNNIAILTMLAKLKAETGDAEYLQSQSYDCMQVGEWCQTRNPEMAMVVYMKGFCDDKVMEVARSNSLYRQLAKYAGSRESPELWEKVLDLASADSSLKDNIMKSINSYTAEEASVLFRSIMTADKPMLLMEVLEEALFNTQFQGNRNLANLLLLTATSQAPERVIPYASRIQNADWSEIALICTNKGLEKEAAVLQGKAKGS